MKHPVEEFVDTIANQLPQIDIKVDQPSRPDGHWFVDLTFDGHRIVVEWRVNYGFGVSSSILEDCYGSGPEEIFPSIDATIARVLGLLRQTVPDR